MTLNMYLGQPCCICIKEENSDLKGSETDVTGILKLVKLTSQSSMKVNIVN